MSEGSWHETVDETGQAIGQPTGHGPAEHPGQMVGRYRLLQLIGEGGFGSVWMAEQREPVKRRVALKIIKLGMDTRQVIARFEAERQALAMMDHPNIARVFDAGATEAGRPYFVMELVRGVQVLEYCDSDRLDTSARLRLFVLVCQAIQHAHQKGIIHRDIKPGNVLVTLHDGVPVPKVIDFGIAKATNQELTSRTLFTEHRQLVGTPAYMSPEQAEMSGLDIDTRSDIYSLGVLLYELLTGTTPFAASDLASRGFAEMMRIIREETPVRPSTRLSALGATAVRTAELRRVADPRRLGLIIRGDLDWIVMKCLEKDRTRRYATANSLAADIERHLRNEPVEAGPPSAAYRMRKFVRRNRGRVAAAGALAAVLVLGAAGTGYGLVRALDEKARAEAAEKETARRADELRQVVEFQAGQMGRLDVETMGVRLRHAILDAAPPERADGLAADLDGVNFTNIALGSLRENVFERTIRLINERFEGQPLVRARLLHSMAETLLQLGLTEMAREPLEFALATRRELLGADDPATLASVANMGSLLVSQGRYAEAEPYHHDALEGRRRVLGADDPATLESLGNLGVLLHDLGRYDEAESAYRAAVEGRTRVLGPDDPETLRAVDHLALLLADRGRLEEAEILARRAVDGRRRVLGGGDPDTLGSVDNLAGLLWRRGQYDEAVRLEREALAGLRTALGDEHSETLSAVTNLGIMLMEQGRLEEAEPYYLEAYEGCRRALGVDHPMALAAANNMAALRSEQGRLPEAEVYQRQSLDGIRRVLGADHPSTLTAVNNLGYTLFAQGRYDEARPYYEEALASRRRVLGDDHNDTLIAINNLGFLLNTVGDYGAAVRLLEAGEADARRVWTGDNLRSLGLYLSKLGQARGGAGEFAAGERALLEAYDLLVSTFGPDSDRTLGAVRLLAELEEAWDKAEPDAGHGDRAVGWRAKLPPE
jgi:tetratricopeptide (TPR) repeat protein